MSVSMETGSRGLFSWLRATSLNEEFSSSNTVSQTYLLKSKEISALARMRTITPKGKGKEILDYVRYMLNT